MPFTAKSGKFNASINTVEIGSGDKAVKLAVRMYYPYILLTHQSRMHRRSVSKSRILVWTMNRTA